MSTDDTINLLLDLATDGATPDTARKYLLRACEAMIEAEHDDLRWAQDEADALDEYRRAYEGRAQGLASRRHVGLPSVLAPPAPDWTYELLHRLARLERRRDDALYAHCAALLAPRPLSGA